MRNFYMSSEKRLPKGWLELLRIEMETKLAMAILESLFMNKVCNGTFFACGVDNGLLKGWLELLGKEMETNFSISRELIYK
jgi:hypothetical protein